MEAFRASTLKLPVGIENFEEIRKLGFYYIDRTRLIEQFLQGWGGGIRVYVSKKNAMYYYRPWDVINFAKKLVSDPSARPSAFWINSSGNDMVKHFVDKADQTTSDEIENTIDNLWSVLFTTGYLTKIGEVKLPDSVT